MDNKRIIPNDILLKEVCRRLAEGNTVKLRPKGCSMRPFIRDGKDVVVLTYPLVLRLGNIVLARVEDSSYVLHRIVKFDKGEIVLMGDANIHRQERCRMDDVYGIAVGLIRDGKYKNITTTFQRVKAILRYDLLPLRRLVNRITVKLNPHHDK